MLTKRKKENATKEVRRHDSDTGSPESQVAVLTKQIDDLSKHLMWEIYKRDFQLFKYDFDNPANKMPLGEVDLAEVHAKLGD